MSSARRYAPYRSAWVRRAEAALAAALASPTGTENSPFRFGDDLRVPLDTLADVVARVARANHWAMFGPDNPATASDLCAALARAGKRVAALTRAPYRGRVHTGLFALGIDVVDDARGDDEPPPDPIGRFVAPAARTASALHSCAECGFATLDAATAGRHAHPCTTRRVELRRPRDAAAVAAAADDAVVVVARVYACANASCAAFERQKLWVSRQAAHQHAKARGCLVRSTRETLIALPG